MSSHPVPSSRPLPSWPWHLALAALVLGSLAIRAWVGSVDLDASRFWDERYGLENVAVVLEEGRLHPANAFHPALAHLPHAALLGTARAVCGHTPVCDDPIVREGRFTPLAYLLSRWLQAVYGALSLVALFWVGRKLFGPTEGLAAAALLAMVPWHVRQSAIYKPDVLLLLLLVMAFGAALWVAERPSWRRHGIAGAAVGLATAAKYNGFTSGIPLFVGAVATARRHPRRVLKLAAAAGVALAVFFALDPHVLTHPEMVERDFGRTLRDYERKGAAAGTAGVDLLAHAGATLVSPSFHGPVVGWAALAGLVLLAVSAFRRRDGGDRHRVREGRLMLVGFPVLYAAFYVVATTNPSDHNWLPLTPFTSLAAAWLGAAGWRRVAGRLPVRGRRPAGVAVLGLLLAVSLGWSLRYAYPATVPTTLDLAGDHLQAALRPDLRGRLVLYQAWGDRWLALKHGYRNKATTVPLEELEAPLPEVVPRMDAAVLREERWEAVAGEMPGSLWEGGTVRYFRPRRLEARGPSLVVLVRPWRRAGEPVPLAAEGGVHTVPVAAVGEGSLPEGARISFAFVLPAGGDPAHLQPTLAGRRLQLFWSHTVHGRHHFVTERVSPPAGEGPWVLEAAPGQPSTVPAARMQVWLPPG